jgi:hypothetical protein
MSKDKTLFSMPAALGAFINDERARAVMKDMAEAAASIARFAGMDIISALAPIQAKAKYRIFAISCVAMRRRDELTSLDSKVEVRHYAHLKAAGSGEQARETELEYMRGRWPESDGWSHTVDVCEATADFTRKMLMLGLCGQLEPQGEEIKDPTPRALTIDESGVKESGLEDVSEAVM